MDTFAPLPAERLLDSGMALRDVLAFVAHEINTPLGLIHGYAHAQLHRSGTFATVPPPSDAVQQALAATERNARHCLALMNLITETSHGAFPRLPRPRHSASELMRTLLENYPFVGQERQHVSMAIEQDFPLPPQAELLHLALCILLRHLLQTLHRAPQPRLQITLDCQGDLHRIRLCGNGAAWPVPSVEALNAPGSRNTDAQHLDLRFCLRVLRTLRGGLHLSSSPQGAEALLQF